MDTNEYSKIICLPGDKICEANDYTIAGHGAFRDGEYLYASLAGEVVEKDQNNQKIITIQGNSKTNRTLPQPGDIVTCEITNTQTNLAYCHIRCCNDHVLRQPYKAMIRRDEIRLQDKDITDMSKCCLPGDIVIGKVVGTGDNGRYMISIAEKEFGVVIATSEAGVSMKPTSLTEMMCLKTNLKEERKVSSIKLG